MAQANDQNGSRLDRIESIMLDLAAASVRQENAIARHDNEFSRINGILAAVAERQSANEQQLATLTAGLLELRNLVVNYIRRREQA